MSVAAALFSLILWSVAPAWMKSLLHEMPAGPLLMIRFSVSVFLLAPLIRPRLGRLRNIPRATLGVFFVALSLNYYLQTMALEAFPASVYIIVFALTPFLSLLVLRLFNLRLLFGSLVAVAGSVFFVHAGDLTTTGSFGAWVSMIGGMIGWVAYTWCLPAFQSEFSDLEITMLSSVVGLIPSIVMALNDYSFWQPTWHATASAAGLGVLFPLAYLTYNYALRWRPAFTIMAQYFDPLIGVASAHFLLGDVLGWPQYVGAGLLTIGVVVSQRAAKD